MNYIIFDLEWNCVKDEITGKNINEIIEIGAVMLNEQLVEISSFSSVVKPQHGVHLNIYVKKLTHISENELADARDFRTVITEFKKWCVSQGKNSVFCTWSNSDLFVLVENYAQSLHRDSVDFITKYVDLQKYVMRNSLKNGKNQIALCDAATQLGLDFNAHSLHRATDDSRLCGRVLERTYDKQLFARQVQSVDRGSFYKRLVYKPFYINDINSPLIDKNALLLHCPKCESLTQRIGAYRCKYKSFVAGFHCENCKKDYLMTVRFKKTFDHVLVSRKIIEQQPQKPVITK